VTGIVPPYTRDALRAHQIQQALAAADGTVAVHEGPASSAGDMERHARVLARAVRAVQALHTAIPAGPDDEGAICPTCHAQAPCETALAAGGGR
jgi:hypothetical protein